MLRVLGRPVAHVPVAVSLVVASIAWTVAHAIDVVALAPASAALVTVFVGIAGLLAGRAVFVRAPSAPTAYGRAFVWPLAISFLTAPTLACAMRIEHPDADYTFAGARDLGVVLILVLSFVAGAAACAIFAGLVSLLLRLRLRTPDDRGARRFAFATWAAAAAVVSLARALAPTRWLDVALITAVSGCALLALASRSPSARALPSDGPYRTDLR